MMKRYKRVFLIGLTVLLAVTSLPLYVFAAPKNTPKEEVVYISMQPDGSVKEINTVNIFDLEEAGTITDYGTYASVRNMTTTDPVSYDKDQVTIDASAGKLYYEGRLTTDVIPWNISIRYYMDGTEYTASELAGKSGALKITMKVLQNPACNSTFFENYALQISLLLDTETCKNILADGATIANVGGDKQLTYTLLPGKEGDMEITADVKDFEMEGISINGLPLNLDIDVDDEELNEKIDEIIQATKDLDQGATELHDGTKELKDGTLSLYEGVSDLYKGTDTLSSGASSLYDATGTLNEKVAELHNGVGNLSGGATTLSQALAGLTAKNGELLSGASTAFSALCTAAQTQLNSALAESGLSPVTLTPDNYSQVLTGLLGQLNADAAYEQAYQAALKQVTAQVEANADQLYQQYIQSQADSLYIQAATKAVYDQCLAAGYTEEQAQAYLQTEEGQAAVSQAVASLTEEQKAQILQTAADSLTDEQKKQIRDAYIEQLMASEEVTKQISDAVAQVSGAAASIATLKGQLDNYALFYQGLQDYTSVVSQTATGAASLQNGLSTLYQNTAALQSAVGELNTATGSLSSGAATLNNGTKELYRGAGDLKEGASSLNDGAAKLQDGTGEFADKTEDMDSQVNDEIDSLLSSVSGSGEVVSFVSEKNTNVKAVQFVIKTDGIQIEEAAPAEEEAQESTSLWQKFLDLFR